MALILKKAQAKDLPELNRLMYGGFIYWNYEPERINRIMALIELNAIHLKEASFYLAQDKGQLIGFFSFYDRKEEPKGKELEYFFIDKKYIRHGYGKKLWELCCKKANSLGIKELIIKSVIEAEGFYLKMGAKRIGEIPSQVTPGLCLPLLIYRLR